MRRFMPWATGEVDVDVLEGGVEAVLVVVDEELVGEVALVGGVAGSSRCRRGRLGWEAPVDVGLLDGVREALDGRARPGLSSKRSWRRGNVPSGALRVSEVLPLTLGSSQP